MADDGKPPAGVKAGSGGGGHAGGPVDGPRRGRPSERPFDLWLHKQLHAMYDEIASEPLPDDLVNLIDRDATQGDAEGKPNDSGSKKA